MDLNPDEDKPEDRRGRGHHGCRGVTDSGSGSSVGDPLDHAHGSSDGSQHERREQASEDPTPDRLSGHQRDENDAQREEAESDPQEDRTKNRTPNLDRLASQGMQFECAYTAQPICSPSRAAIMTGKCPARLNLTNFLPGRADAPAQKLLQPVIEGQLPREDITVAELLHEAGYATACIGKWHLGGQGFEPQDQGFDFAFAGKAVTKPDENEGSKGESELTTQAEQWLETNKEHPFFLYLAHNTPHIPFAATPAELEKMYRAGQIVWGALEEMRTMIRPGISTKELDEFAEGYTKEHGARPAFKGYRGYPGSVCTSINQEVVHGIPSAARKLREGDILSMDFGVELDGYFGDAALTVPVGKVTPEREKLLRVTRESLEQSARKDQRGALGLQGRQARSAPPA